MDKLVNLMSKRLTEKTKYFSNLELAQDDERRVRRFTCYYHAQNPDGTQSETTKSVSVTVPLDKEINDEVAGQVINTILAHIKKENNIVAFPCATPEPTQIDVSVILNQLAQQQQINKYLLDRINDLAQKFEFLHANVFVTKQALDLNGILSTEQFDQAWDLVITKKQLQQMKSLSTQQSEEPEQAEQGDPAGEEEEKQCEPLTQNTSLLSHMLRKIHHQSPNATRVDWADSPPDPPTPEQSPS